MTALTGRKRRLVQIAIVAFGLALALVSLRPETLIAGRPVFSGATDSFRYGGRVENSGEVALVVSADWHDPQALQTYLAANLRRGERLIAQGGGALVPVQITFARPLALEEVRALVAQTGFQVESFILVGRSTLTQQRGGYGRLASSLDGDILPSEREEGRRSTGHLGRTTHALTPRPSCATMRAIPDQEHLTHGSHYGRQRPGPVRQ